MADTTTLHARLVALLIASERLRRTAPVDDDFPEMMHNHDSAMRAAREALDAAGGVEPFDLVGHLFRQRAFSLKTFGPGERTAGVLDHIRKELAEVAADPGDVMEWIDLVILALDGAWRAGHEPRAIVDALVAKQTRNEGRTWPDWRTADPTKAIEHDRTGEPTDAEHAAVLASIPRPDAPTADHAPPEHVLPNLSDWQDRIAAVMEAWRGQNGGIFAVNGCALEVAKLFLVGWAGSLAPDASGEQVAAHYNLEDLERKRQAAEVECTERDAELSALRGRVAGLTDTLTMVAWTLGMEVEDGEPIGQLALESAIKRLRESSDRREAQATEAMRMLWLVVREAGGAASIPVQSMRTADWSTCQLARSDNVATGDVELFAQVRGELSKPRTTQHQAMHQQLLEMLGAGDHQGAAARIGELVGLELLLHAGGAGKGVTAIAQERRRQIEGERFDPTADQQYRQGELARAAACYVRLEAMRSVAAAVPGTAVDDRVPPEWPWARCGWKPKDRRSNLVRAGALIAAELDRMDREGAANA